MVYAVNENMEHIKITNQAELVDYLQEYDVEHQFEDKPIGVPIVFDDFLESENGIRELYQLFFKTRTGKLPHFIVITESTLKEHFDVFDGGIVFDKTDFGKLFHIVGDFRSVVTNYIKSNYGD